VGRDSYLNGINPNAMQMSDFRFIYLMSCKNLNQQNGFALLIQKYHIRPAQQQELALVVIERLLLVALGKLNLT
jgi:hypothetical protein